MVTAYSLEREVEVLDDWGGVDWYWMLEGVFSLRSDAEAHMAKTYPGEEDFRIKEWQIGI